MQSPLWQIGNKSPRAFAAHEPLKILLASLPRSTKKPTTPWWPLNWRNILRLPPTISTPQNGTDRAAERFRRADWKTKAQEAAVRLGAEPNVVASALTTEMPVPAAPVLPIPEPGMPFEGNIAAFESIVASDGPESESDSDPSNAAPESSSEPPTPTAGLDSDDKRRRRRGRRGGRNRRKPGSATELSSSTTSRQPSTPTPRRSASPPPPEVSEPEPRQVSRRSMPPLPVETLPDSGVPGPKGRYGDPGLSSRISLLEMQFRRLLSCEAVKLEEANTAPVGPGVFVLTDSDLTSYYYVESCQTLRIAVANLLRGNASRRGAESITKQLSEHLGITEARVPKYLAEHCVVRWLQLDEGASHFAHFVIAVCARFLTSSCSALRGPSSGLLPSLRPARRRGAVFACRDRQACDAAACPWRSALSKPPANASLMPYTIPPADLFRYGAWSACGCARRYFHRSAATISLLHAALSIIQRRWLVWWKPRPVLPRGCGASLRVRILPLAYSATSPPVRPGARVLWFPVRA